MQLDKRENAKVYFSTKLIRLHPSGNITVADAKGERLEELSLVIGADGGMSAK